MTDLDHLVKHMQPRLNPGVYAYCLLNECEPVPPGALFWFSEREGKTVIVPLDVAVECKLNIGFLANWITLDVQSALSAIGLTAVVSNALTDAKISCNIVAAFHHDHLFVPEGQGVNAVRVLKQVQKNRCIS